jgi:dihydrofolate reductase
MRIIGIVAADKNWAIGKKNGLLYELPTDMKHFKETTSGHFVLCGYNTLMSFPKGKALPNRITICLTSKDLKRDDCIITHSIEEMLETVKEIGPNADFYVIGGGMLYNAMLPYYNEVIVTKVEAEDPEATVFFPNLDENDAFMIKSESIVIDDGDYEIKFITYKRK